MNPSILTHNPNQNMIIYGAGGHAKIIISILKATRIEIDGIFDDDLSKDKLSGIEIQHHYNYTILPKKKLIIAIGNNMIRRNISERINHQFGNIIHPSAIVDQSVKISEGTCVMHNAVIQADTTIGKHVIINTSASIDHDCIIEDFVHIAPGVVLAGGVRIAENTLVGIGSFIAPGITIGKNCLISIGSVVTKNIPDGVTVRGNPARIITH